MPIVAGTRDFRAGWVDVQLAARRDGKGDRGKNLGSLVEIKESQSARLQQIAAEKGVTPNALLEQALELLFQQEDREQVAHEEQALLRQLQAEGQISSSARKRSPFHPDEIILTHTITTADTTL